MDQPIELIVYLAAGIILVSLIVVLLNFWGVRDDVSTLTKLFFQKEDTDAKKLTQQAHDTFKQFFRIGDSSSYML